MKKLISSDEFVALFPTVKRSMWRWQCQADYRVDHAVMQRWRDGERELPNVEDWGRYIRGLHSAGIPFERAKMLSEPVTDCLTWTIAVTNWNVDAGEDIRWIKESRARDLGAPEYDFCIFDNNRVVILLFDDETVWPGDEVVDDEDVVAEHRAWRDTVWPHAVRHRECLFDVIKKGVELP